MKLEPKTIDLKKFPEPTAIIAADPNHPMEFTQGDMHGNTKKKLHFLIQHGLVDMTPDDYQAFIDCYKYFDNFRIGGDTSNKLTEIVANLNQFKKILKRIKIIDINKFRSIGDDVGDRGANDLLTILFDGWLRNEGLDHETLLSNHGIETLHAYEMLRRGKEIDLKAPHLMMGHAVSLQAMNELFLKTGIITKEEFFELFETAYLPSLKVLSYTANRATKELCIYSHAAIDEKVIEHIAFKLGVEYDWTNIDTKTATIDRINAAFAEHVKNHTVHTLYEYDAMMQGYGANGGGPLDPAFHPFEFLMWNRDYTNLKRDAEHNDEKQYWCHGHDPRMNAYPKDPAHIFGIDDGVGKGGREAGQILVVEGPYTPVPQQKNTVDVKFFEPSSVPAAIPEEFVTPQEPVVSPLMSTNTTRGQQPIGTSQQKPAKYRNQHQPSNFAKNNAGFFAASGTGAVIGAALLAALITTAVVSLGASLGIGLGVIALGLVIGLIIKAAQHHKNKMPDQAKYHPLPADSAAMSV